ncbi:MAG: histidine phosphatase family protein [Clostridiaceae bacterium]|nr:histidine phosphatase family protein [Clostridiaceae bacterium]
MKTTVYFLRHAQSDNSVKDDMLRPLTGKGLHDRHKVTEYLRDKAIAAVYSSPYQRAIDTVRPLSELLGLRVVTDFGFRERDLGDSGEIPNFKKRQWLDKDFSAPGGESVRQVQQRIVTALKPLIKKHEGQSIVIGCHGMAMCALTNFFDASFEYEAYISVSDIMPRIVELVFEDDKCVLLKQIDTFE